MRSISRAAGSSRRAERAAGGVGQEGAYGGRIDVAGGRDEARHEGLERATAAWRSGARRGASLRASAPSGADDLGACRWRRRDARVRTPASARRSRSSSAGPPQPARHSDREPRQRGRQPHAQPPARRASSISVRTPKPVAPLPSSGAPVRPGRAGDVHVHPGRVVHELAQELGRVAGGRLALLGRVGQVGVLAARELEVLGMQRQPPADLPGRCRRPRRPRRTSRRRWRTGRRRWSRAPR